MQIMRGIDLAYPDSHSSGVSSCSGSHTAGNPALRLPGITDAISAAPH